MKGDWHKKFKQDNRLLIDDKTYENAHSAILEDLPTYLRHISKGASVLECCCGPGYTAVPLSHHFKITAFDKDENILESAKENAKRFGKDITFRQLDFFDILKEFGKDSFDAVSSGGVLEHFPKKEILKLMDLQLSVAPVVFAQMPLFEPGEAENNLNPYGIEHYSYSEKDWIDDILSGYNILEYRVLAEKPKTGRFREFMAVIGR